MILPVVMAAGSMAMDLREGKVDNGWILFCLAIGLLVRLLLEGPGGAFSFLCGAALPLMLLGWLFVFHMLGAGDIKLFCALGGVLGAGNVLKCIICSLFIGAGISAAILISNRNISERFHYFIHYFTDLLQTKERKPYARKGMERLENFHFTVPVFLSVLLYAGGVY